MVGAHRAARRGGGRAPVGLFPVVALYRDADPAFPGAPDWVNRESDFGTLRWEKSKVGDTLLLEDIGHEMGAKVLLWQVQQQGTDALSSRILDERHFEFRGGWYRGTGTDLRTRASDAAYNGPV